MIARAADHRPSRSRLRRFLAALGSGTIVGTQRSPLPS
jgi:hypothetical protein